MDDEEGAKRAERRASKRSARVSDIYTYEDEEDEPSDAGELSVASTRTDESINSLSDGPAETPPVDLATALETYRGDVNGFIAWQIKQISEQTAALKATHGYLRRLMRKRNQRQTWMDKTMMDTFRASRQRVRSPTRNDGSGTLGEPNGPAPISIPFEAYLPSKARGSAQVTDIGEFCNRGPRDRETGAWKPFSVHW